MFCKETCREVGAFFFNCFSPGYLGSQGDREVHFVINLLLVYV